MDGGTRATVYLLVVTLSYWIIGSVVWIRRQRHEVRRAAAAVVAEHANGDREVVIKGQINLPLLAACAILPPLVLAILLLTLT